MKYKVTNGKTTHDVEIIESEKGLFVRYTDPDGKVEEFPVDFKAVGKGSLYSMIVRNESYRLVIDRNKDKHAVYTRGHRFEFLIEDERTHLMRSFIADAAHAGGGEVKAPIPGLVTKVMVAEGDEVAQGQGMVILEAMKMENEIKSPTSGKITAVNVRPGKNVEKGQVLITIG
jgi:biotin carboxyl carrier protein